MYVLVENKRITDFKIYVLIQFYEYKFYVIFFITLCVNICILDVK